MLPVRTTQRLTFLINNNSDLLENFSTIYLGEWNLISKRVFLKEVFKNGLAMYGVKNVLCFLIGLTRQTIFFLM